MRILALLTLVVSLAVAAGAGQGSSASPRRPNIVFIVTDDLSWNLVQYMPRLRQLQAEGTTFSRFFVSNSLCCPSRASILTGKFPHNTGIYTNGGREGGFARFHDSGLERETFATRLRSSGYTTALMGKYLNEYTPTRLVDGAPAYVPPGWDEWDVAGKGYTGFDYLLNENHRLRNYGHSPEQYVTDVLAAKGVEFINRVTNGRKPFFLEIAPFAPHSPYTPAPRHETMYLNLKAPRTPAFNESDLSDKPSWLKHRRSLRSLEVSTIDEVFRKRVQAVQSVDELLGQLQDALRARGQLSNTYIFFTSDNGLHLGEHRLAAGKQTAFETDIHVPLIVTGPGVPRRSKLPHMTSTIDLYPTFAQLAGSPIPLAVDGRSLLPLLSGQTVTGWRTAVLVEHHGPDVTRGDPDFPGPSAGNPISYRALRTERATYIQYSNGEEEYYDLKKDPYQLTNSAKLLKPLVRGALHSRLEALERCVGNVSCWAAAGGQ
ncbi:MAG: sulfatase [Actinobacteria bacterium]|nr:sulfatase [Actinomycetota bacterium]